MGNRRRKNIASKVEGDKIEGSSETKSGVSPGVFGERLARGFTILRCFESGEQDLSNQEIADLTVIPKPTVSRLTFTLMALGYLTYNERTGSYKLGPSLLALAKPLLFRSGLLSLARPMIRKLADKSGLTVAIGRRAGLEMVYIDAVRGNNPIMLDQGIGSLVPIFRSAMGRAYLAALTERDRATLCNQLVEDANCSALEIKKELKQIDKVFQAFGYCTTFAEVHPEVNAVAVPLVVNGTDEVMALMCGGPAFRLTPNWIHEEVGPRLIEIAGELSASPDSK